MNILQEASIEDAEVQREAAIEKFVREYAANSSRESPAARPDRVLPDLTAGRGGDDDDDDDDDDPMNSSDAWSDFLALTGGETPWKMVRKGRAP